MQCTLKEVEPEKKMRISGGNSACDSILSHASGISSASWRRLAAVFSSWVELCSLILSNITVWIYPHMAHPSE